MASIGPTIGIKGESAYTNAMKRIVAETKTLDSEMNLLTSTFKKNDNAIETNRKKQEMLTKQLEQAQKQLYGLRDGLALTLQKQEESRKAVEAAQKAHEEAVRVYGKESEEAKKTATAWEKASTQYQITSRDVERFTTNVNNQQAEINRLIQAIKDLPSNLEIVGQKMQEVGTKFTEVGSTLTKYITTPLLAAGTAFVKWSSDFTDGMAKIYTIADETKKPMAEMRQELIDLSNQSGYSLEDLAEAEYQAVSASVDTSKAVSFLTDATRLARGGFTSTTQAVDLLTTVINAYGYQAEDAAYISDVLLRTQNDGKTIIDELAQSMGTVIPTAANYNVTLEQLAAAYATMTKQGVNTSRATTFLNAMFTELEKSSSAISKILDHETGKSFAQLMGEGKSLAEVLDILYNAVDGDNEQFQRLFGNIRSGKAASALLTDDFAILNYEVERMNSALGQTDTAMEVLETPSLKAKRAIQQLKNSGMELGTTFINELYPYFLQLVDGIKKATEWFGSLDEGTKQAIVNTALFAGAIGPVLVGIGKLTTGVGSILTVVGKATKSFRYLADDGIMNIALSLEKINPMFGDLALKLGTSMPWLLALGAAFTGIAVATEDAMEKQREEILTQWGMAEAVRENITASKEAAVAYAERKLAIQEEQAATAGQVETAKALVDEYNNLVDANGEIAEGDQELATLIQTELAEALGMELSDVQELVEENGRYGASIEDTMNKILQRAELRAYEEMYSEAIKRKTQAEADYKTQLEELETQHQKTTEAQRNLEQAQNDLADAQRRGESDIGTYKNALDNAINALGAATAEEEKLKEAVNNTRQNVDSATQDANNSAEKIRQITGETMADVQNKIIVGGSGVARAADSVASQAESNMTIDGDTLGYNAVSGFAGGLSRYAYLAANSAASMARQAAASARYALSIESPSKVMAEVGKFFDKGFAVGIEGNMNEVTQAATMLANAAVGGVQMVGYEPYPSNTYNKTISAPINIALTVEGNVDGDDRQFTRNIAEDLVNLMNRESEVFA